jgi:hypothetical protein
MERRGEERRGEERRGEGKGRMRRRAMLEAAISPRNSTCVD